MQLLFKIIPQRKRVPVSDLASLQTEGKAQFV